MKKEDYLNSVNLNAETDFPYLVMEIINDQSYPRNPGFHVMHWHEDLQFICVLEGDIILKTLQDEHPVHAGEAVLSTKTSFIWWSTTSPVTTTVSSFRTTFCVSTLTARQQD